jgi:hypothetical protein
LFKLYERLPETIDVNGNLFKIKTDFKTWLAFLELAQKEELQVNDYLFMLQNKEDKKKAFENLGDFATALFDFMNKSPATPNVTKGEDNDTQIIDFTLDSPYIYASFMQAYNIDLIETNMHWYKFNALFLGLPNNTKICEIMQARAYKKCEDSEDKLWKKKKEYWQLPQETVKDEEIEQYWDDLFGGY